jgi:hypothetical protein
LCYGVLTRSSGPFDQMETQVYDWPRDLQWYAGDAGEAQEESEAETETHVSVGSSEDCPRDEIDDMSLGASASNRCFMSDLCA